MLSNNRLKTTLHLSEFSSSSLTLLSDLLEKSRAVHQATDERTFHIFYQMICGMNANEKKEFIIEDAKTYKFLSNGNLPVPGVNDSQEFEDTKEAMDIMGMSEEEQSCRSCDLCWAFDWLHGVRCICIRIKKYICHVIVM